MCSLHILSQTRRPPKLLALLPAGRAHCWCSGLPPPHTHTGRRWPGGWALVQAPLPAGAQVLSGGPPAPRHSFPSPFALWWQRTASPASALVVCILVQSVISAGFSISHYQLLKDSSDSARTAPGPRPASAPAGSGKTRFPSGSCSHAVRVSPHLRPGPPVWVPGFPEDSSSVALYRKVPSRPSFIM